MSVPSSDIMTSDEFELAFGTEAGGEAEKTEEVKTEEVKTEEVKTEEVKTEEVKTEEVKTEEVKTEPAAKTPEELAAEAAKAAEDAEKARKAEVDKIVADRLAAEQKKTEDARKAEEARIAAEAKKAEEAKKLELSPEDKKLFEDVAKDFPDVTKVLEVQKRQLKAEFDAQLEVIKADLQKSIAPLAQASQTVAANAFEAAVMGKHPAFKDEMDAITAWIDTQPPLLKRAYDAVLDTPGTPASDVVALFDLWKEATKAPAKDEAAEAARLAAEAEKQKKLDAQEGIRGRRTERKDAGPLDFDTAFASVQ